MNLDEIAKQLAEEMITASVFEDAETGKTMYAVCLEYFNDHIMMTEFCENEVHLVDCQRNIQTMFANALAQILEDVKSTDDFTCPIANKLMAGLGGAKLKKLDGSSFALMEDVLEEDEIELVLAWRKQKTRSYKRGRAAGMAKEKT